VPRSECAAPALVDIVGARETRLRVCAASGKAELTSYVTRHTSYVTRHTDDVIPTSRDIWTIVETPLAGARGYQKSKIQMTLV